VAAVALTLLEGAAVVLVTYVLAKLLSAVTRRASRNALWDLQLVLLAGRVMYVVVLSIGLLAFLYVVAPSLVGPVLGAVGLLGLAIGLAFQDVLRNWISGFFLLLERPFRIGDEINVTGFSGTVETVELRTTVLRTEEGRKIMVPNQVVYTSALVNSSFYPLRQTITRVRIPADRDPTALLRETRAELDRVNGISEDPAPTVALVPRPDADTALEARYWIDYLHHDADAVEREVNARMVFVVAGANISADDIAVTRQAPFRKTTSQTATPRQPTKVRTRPGVLGGGRRTPKR
jgi:small-conductance mechanosensitive channel